MPPRRSKTTPKSGVSVPPPSAPVRRVVKRRYASVHDFHALLTDGYTWNSEVKETPASPDIVESVPVDEDDLFGLVLLVPSSQQLLTISSAQGKAAAVLLTGTLLITWTTTPIGTFIFLCRLARPLTYGNSKVKVHFDHVAKEAPGAAEAAVARTSRGKYVTSMNRGFSLISYHFYRPMPQKTVKTAGARKAAV